MARRYRICLMSEGGSTASVRSLSASAFWPKTLISGFVFVVCALALYSAYAWWTLSRVKDQTLELDILKGESAGKDSQLLALGERLEDMGRSLESLKERERDLALLTREFNKTLGLPDSATLEEVWPALTSTVAWTWGGESQGGVAPDADRRTEFKSPAEVIKTLHDDLDRLERNAAGVDMALSELTSALEGSKSLLAATPMLIPVPKGRFTSGFGYRASPFGGGSDLHLGVDLAAPIGTAVYAPADGVVLSSDWSSSGYGQMITIDHGYGLTTRYAHLSESLVKAGEAVARGELIAKVGNSGRSTGPHLHFETIMGGVHVDPLIFSGAAQAKKAADAKISNRSKGGVKGEAKPKADANGDVKDAAKSEPKPKPKPKPKADANGEAKDAASSEVKPKPKPKPKADASGEAKDAASSEPKPKPKPKADANGDAKDAASSEVKPKPKPKPKPKADANGEAKDAASSEVKPKPKPKPKADSNGGPEDTAKAKAKSEAGLPG